MFRALGSLLKWIILLPIFAAIVLLAVANDASVTIHLNPFDTSDPVLRFDLPLYQLGFGLFALGVIVGGLIVWTNQGKHRRRARQRQHDAVFWQRQAERRPAEPAHAEGTVFLPRPERG